MSADRARRSWAACPQPGSRPPQSAQMHHLVAVPADDYRIYALAVRRLKHRLGRHAPDVTALIGHELSMRNVQMIVDEYLEARRRHRGRAAART